MNRYPIYAQLPTSTSASPTGCYPSTNLFTQTLVSLIVVGGALTTPGTSSGASTECRQRAPSNHRFVLYEQQYPKTTLHTPQDHELHRQKLSELRHISGLTWEELAQLFDVSRRSVHFWASGKPLGDPNQEKLHKFLACIRKLDTGSAKANRKLLFQEQDGEPSIFQLLQQGAFDRAIARTTVGPKRPRYELTKLSVESLAERTPPKPEELVGAKQDPLEQDKKQTRSPKVARKKTP